MLLYIPLYWIREFCEHFLEVIVIGTPHSRKFLQSAQSFPSLPQGRLIYMIDPQYYTIVQAINPHMQDSGGKLHRVDAGRARSQWQSLQEVYRDLGFHVEVLKPSVDCADMVFCANQTFPFLKSDGTKSVIMSNMANDLRHLEVRPIAEQLTDRGVDCHALPSRSASTLFEGMGDALWVPGRNLICGGYGFRTHHKIYETLEAITGASVVLFELTHPKFYHLDTCLSILDEASVLACREGFTSEGWEQLSILFKNVIEVPLEEADAPGFACNAHSPDGKHVVLQRGNQKTSELLFAAGFVPIEVDSDEFIKSGGSVFCMKLQALWDD